MTNLSLSRFDAIAPGHIVYHQESGQWSGLGPIQVPVATGKKMGSWGARGAGASGSLPSLGLTTPKTGQAMLLKLASEAPELIRR